MFFIARQTPGAVAYKNSKMIEKKKIITWDKKNLTFFLFYFKVVI